MRDMLYTLQELYTRSVPVPKGWRAHYDQHTCGHLLTCHMEDPHEFRTMEGLSFQPVMTTPHDVLTPKKLWNVTEKIFLRDHILVSGTEMIEGRMPGKECWVKQQWKLRPAPPERVIEFYKREEELRKPDPSLPPPLYK